MNSFARERLYYEIAMSIGNSLDMDVMLKEGLPTYLRRLNCLAGAVLRRVEDGGGVSSFELVQAIPRRMKRNSAVETVLAQLPRGLNAESLQEYLAALPVMGESNGLKHYLMELPEFGLLLLIKSFPGFSRPDLKSLIPLNRKLAGACVSCDAKERLQSEIREREKMEEQYKAIFDNAVEGIFQSTMDGRFVSVNPAMARLFGYETPEELMANVSNLATQAYVRPEDRERFIRRLISKGRVSGFEFEYRRRDGTRGWLSSSARLIRQDDGTPSHVEGMSEDVTAKKQAIIALREAKLEAERLSQLKSNFLSMVSHELRTPLTSILGFAKITRKKLFEILSTSNDCPESVAIGLQRIDTNTGVIITEGERLTELINNVLDLAKLEAGEFQWDMEEVNMVEVLVHSLAATGVLFKDTKVALMQQIPASLPPVTGDRDRLTQVVINLLSNSAKFTDEGVVTVSAVHDEDEIVIRVSDTGIGVPDEDVSIVFDKFRQLGNTLTDKPKGTGLGLPICKEIIEHHNGKIWVESGSRGGSVFAFTLPVKK